MINNSISDSSGESSSAPDEFRRIEKLIKNHYKSRSFTNCSNQCRKKSHSKGVINYTPNIQVVSILDICNSTENDIYLSKSEGRVINSSALIGNYPFILNDNAIIYEFKSAPSGFYVIKGALDVSQQMQLAKVCLENYSCSSHTNLTNLSALAGNDSDIGPECSRLWDEAVRDGDRSFKLFRPLRWACLGYHYDWTARMYRQNLKSNFPEDLANLCKSLAQLVGLDITAEAAIVNYYPRGTTMSGHIDDAEHTMDEPIVSISLGCPAVFLIGGKTKNIAPTPILLRSGDVVVMSGESRTVYHGVALVLDHKDVPPTADPDPGPPLDQRTVVEETNPIMPTTLDISNAKDEFDPVLSYLQTHRININVRRVVAPSGIWTDKCGSGAMLNENIPS